MVDQYFGVKRQISQNLNPIPKGRLSEEQWQPNKGRIFLLCCGHVTSYIILRLDTSQNLHLPTTKGLKDLKTI